MPASLQSNNQLIRMVNYSHIFTPCEFHGCDSRSGSAISHFLPLIHQFSQWTLYCGFHLLPRLWGLALNK